MRLRVLIAVCVVVAAGWLLTVPAGSVPAAVTPTTVPSTAPPVTINEFLPEDRGLGDCISAIPKPGCGSKARGGWRQTMIFLLLVAGLAVIAWRVVAGARAAKRQQTAAG